MRSSLLLGASSKSQLVEALTVIIDAIARKIDEDSATVTVRYAQVEELIFPPEEEKTSNDEQEWSCDDDLTGKMWGVRRILDRFKRDGKTYYLINKLPTEEPRENIPVNLIAAFNKQQRALVRRTYNEDEAEEV